MAQPGQNAGRQWAASPRAKPKDGARNTLCRNVVIYGHCKNEKDGCIYSHEKPGGPTRAVENGKQRLNVDSPSFTPFEPSSSRATGLSPHIANAAIFTPSSTPSASISEDASRNPSSEWGQGRGIPEFVPQNYQQTATQSEASTSSALHDPFTSYDGASQFMGLNSSSAGQVNPYATDASVGSGAAAAFYSQHATYQQPLQYHLYAPLGPHRDNIPAFLKAAHDFFLPENLRQEMQRENEAALQIIPNLNLPASVEHYHSLVPLDISHTKNNASYGYNTWTYKAVSSKDGLTYVIRRLEGFRLTDEKAIYSKQAWKRLNSASAVTLHDCFTTRAFGDSSLVFVTDYHPLSKTLAEHHFSSPFNRRSPAGPVPEDVLWSYIAQITSALKTIHANGLAAQLITPSKVLLTGKNRLRLNACGIFDVIRFEEQPPLAVLQQDDLRQFGQLILAIGTLNASATWTPKTVDVFARMYSDRLRSFLATLLDPAPSEQPVGVDSLMSAIADHAFDSFDRTLHLNDTLCSTLNQELENARLVRLMAKLGSINERPEYDAMGPSWTETGERYYLRLFRDYVFHQVGLQGDPVVDLGLIITTLNKLDAGSEERITLSSRDEATIFVVSFKELKRALESAFNELLQAQRVS